MWLFFGRRARLGGDVKLRLEIKRYRLPLRVAVRTAHGVMTEREGVWLKIEDEAGRVGIGEAATLPWFGTEAAEEAEAVLRGMGEWVEAEVLGKVPARLGCVRNAVAEARAMLEEGGEDARQGGNEKRESAAYLPVAALLPAGRMVLQAIEPKAEAGFRVFKWKVGVGDLADELALLDDVCAKLPEGAKLRLDANGAWDRRRAEKWLERCAERPVEFVEQPIAREARGAEDVLRGLAEDYPVEIALDESLVGDGDVERWLGAGWRGVYVVKSGLVGDVRGVLERLGKAGAKVVFSSALETAVGARAALRRAFAWAGERRALGFGVWPLFADGRFDGPAAAPFVRREDVERIDVEALWNELS